MTDSPDRTAARRTVHTDAAPAAVGPYSQAVVGGGLVFTAGQIGLPPEGGALVEGGVEAEARQALRNLRAVLEAAGSAPERVVKTTVFVVDLNDYARVNAIYGELFPEAPPARSAVEVSALPLGARVEIEAVALAS